MKKKSPLPPGPTFTPRDVSSGLTSLEDVNYPLRWGVVGVGEISRQFVRSSRECPGATMAAAFSRSQDKADSFAASHGVEKGYDNLERMLDGEDLDVVYIGTPDEMHKEHCLLAMEAGKHVLCEKALAKNVADAREMYAAAERNGVMLQDGVWTRFFPAVEHARSLIESGEIGDVVMVQSDFESLYTAQAAILAYGAQAKPIHIQAAGSTSGPGGAILEYENDRFAILTFVSYPSEFPEVTEITGTKGRITLEQPGHCPTRLSVRVPVAAPSRYRGGNTPSPVQEIEYPLPDSISLPGAYPNQQGFIYMTEAIHRCLAAGLRECPQFVQAESLLLLELLETIRGLRAENK